MIEKTGRNGYIVDIILKGDKVARASYGWLGGEKTIPAFSRRSAGKKIATLQKDIPGAEFIIRPIGRVAFVK